MWAAERNKKMNVLIMILGILMVLCGGSCIFTPLRTFLASGYALMVLLLVYGVAGIVKSIATKKYGVNFAFSIISVIAGLVMVFMPGLQLMADGIFIYMMAGWFILQGIVSIVLSMNFKGTDGGKKWIWGLVLGILGIILGLYSLFHPALLALTTGMLIGTYFIESGINMIFLSSQNTNN